jgi:hypothetical protein
MGADSSGTAIGPQISSTVINQTDIDILNNYLTNIATNITMSAAAKCTSDTTVTQTSVYGTLMADGSNSVVDVGNDASVIVNFSCVNAQSTSNTISQDLINSITEEISSRFSPTVLAEISGTSGTSSGVGIDTETDNYTTENIINTVTSNVTNNFSSSVLSDCISSTRIAQFTSADLALATNGGTVTSRNTVAANVVAECSALQDSIADMTSDIAQELGLTISDTVTPSVSSSISSPEVSSSAGSAAGSTAGTKSNSVSESGSGSGSDSDSGISTSAIAGIIIGIIVLIALIVGAIYLVKYFQ